MAKKNKYLHAKIPTKAISYQKYLASELDKLKHHVKFSFHEYNKQMPAAMQEIYEMTSQQMRDLECMLLVLRNSKKQICAHMMIDCKFYLTSYKPSQREDLDTVIESVKRNFIIPLEKFIDGKQA